MRRASSDDAAGIARVCAATGQVGTGTGADRAYVDLLLATGTVVVAVDDEEVMGWGATRPLSLGEMLTDLFVDPQRHGQGVGTRVLSVLWPDPLAPARFTFSSQHLHAVPLYQRAGLQPRWQLLYLDGSRARLPESSYRVDPVHPGAAAAADRGLGGGDRGADYAYWAGLPGHEPITVSSPVGVVAVGVLGPEEVVHLTVADEAEARDCVVAALRSLRAEVVRCCVPADHPATTSLLAAGLRVTDQDLAMATADGELPTTWVYSPGLG